MTKMGAFWRIVYPLAKSPLITMSILAFAGTWNSYLIPSTFTNNPDKYVLVVGLNSVKDMVFENTPLIMAGVVLSTLPILIFFFFYSSGSISRAFRAPALRDNERLAQAILCATDRSINPME